MIGAFILENWLAIVAAISTVLGPLSGYLIGRRARRIKNKKGDLENIDKILKIYRDSLDDLKSKLDDINDSYETLERMYNDALSKVIKYKAENEKLRKEHLTIFRLINTCQHDCKIKTETKNGNGTTLSSLT